jgi:hypothetical protein
MFVVDFVIANCWDTLCKLVAVKMTTFHKINCKTAKHISGKQIISELYFKLKLNINGEY